jgi:hypothetical protein
VYLHVLKELIGVFGFGFDDDNFNFVVVVEKIGYEFALGHVEYPLLDSRHCQLLLDADIDLLRMTYTEQTKMFGS